MNHTTYQKARDKKELRNCDIAKALNVSESYVSKIMAGERVHGKHHHWKSTAGFLERLHALLGIVPRKRKTA